MKENKWYVLKPECVEEFVNNAPVANIDLIDILKKPFKVALLKSSNFGDWIEKISFGTDPKEYTPSDFFDNDGKPIDVDGWITGREFKFFKEVHELSHQSKEDCILVLHFEDHSEVLGRIDGSPARMDRNQAEAKAKSLLSEYSDSKIIRVEIFSLETTACVVSEIKFS